MLYTAMILFIYKITSCFEIAAACRIYWLLEKSAIAISYKMIFPTPAGRSYLRGISLTGSI